MCQLYTAGMRNEDSLRSLELLGQRGDAAPAHRDPSRAFSKPDFVPHYPLSRKQARGSGGGLGDGRRKSFRVRSRAGGYHRGERVGAAYKQAGDESARVGSKTNRRVR